MRNTLLRIYVCVQNHFTQPFSADIFHCMTYQLGYMVIITELSCTVCHTPVERHVALDMSADVNRASQIAVVVFVSPIFLIKTLHQRFIQEIGEQMQQDNI